MRHDVKSAVFESRRNEDIEILRGIAILFVLADHIFSFWQIPGFQSTLGDYASFWGGVDLFFSISGFVITQSLLRSMVDRQSTQDRLAALASFWIKRAWRLWPAAWLWLIVPFVIALATIPEMRQGAFLRANVSYLLGGVFSVVNIQEWAYWQRNGMQSLTAGPYWSLSLEEQFYLLCAPLLLFVPRKWVVGILLAAIAIQFPMARHANSDDLSWFIRSDAFAWGVLLAFVSANTHVKSLLQPSLLRRRGFALAFLIFAMTSIAVMPQLMYSLPFNVALIAVLSVTLVFIASYDSGYLGLSGLTSRLLSWIGDRSYAIYLVNGSVIALSLHVGLFDTMNRTELSNLLAISAAMLGAIFFLAELTYRFVEIPARLYGRRLASAYEDTQRRSDHREPTPVEQNRDRVSA